MNASHLAVRFPVTVEKSGSVHGGTSGTMKQKKRTWKRKTRYLMGSFGKEIKNYYGEENSNFSRVPELEEEHNYVKFVLKCLVL